LLRNIIEVLNSDALTEEMGYDEGLKEIEKYHSIIRKEIGCLKEKMNDLYMKLDAGQFDHVLTKKQLEQCVTQRERLFEKMKVLQGEIDEMPCAAGKQQSCSVAKEKDVNQKGQVTRVEKENYEVEKKHILLNEHIEHKGNNTSKSSGTKNNANDLSTMVMNVEKIEKETNEVVVESNTPSDKGTITPCLEENTQGFKERVVSPAHCKDYETIVLEMCELEGMINTICTCVSRGEYVSIS